MLAKKKRVKKTAEEREGYEGLKEVDCLGLQAAIAKRSPEEVNIIRYSASLATGTSEKLHELGLTESNVCLLCGQKESSTTHMQWQCEVVKAKRKKTYITQIDPRDMPVHLLHGMPGSLEKDIHTTYWGKNRAEIHTEDEYARVRMGLPQNNRQWVFKKP